MEEEERVALTNVEPPLKDTDQVFAFDDVLAVKPVPLIVTNVPPVAGPLNGDTLVTLWASRNAVVATASDCCPVTVSNRLAPKYCYSTYQVVPIAAFSTPSVSGKTPWSIDPSLFPST